MHPGNPLILGLKDQGHKAQMKGASMCYCPLLSAGYFSLLLRTTCVCVLSGISNVVWRWPRTTRNLHGAASHLGREPRRAGLRWAWRDIRAGPARVVVWLSDQIRVPTVSNNAAELLYNWRAAAEAAGQRCQPQWRRVYHCRWGILLYYYYYYY